LDPESIGLDPESIGDSGMEPATHIGTIPETADERVVPGLVVVL
jgi:hypothetical protein